MIRLLAIVALCSSAVASADWLTSTFTVNGTFVDLVQLKRAPAFKVSGKAVVAKDMSAGHLVISGKPFDCSSVGQGVLPGIAREQIICNMRPSTFLALLNESTIKGGNFNLAVTTMASYFNRHPSVDYTTIPVAIPGAADEEDSEYTLSYLEPMKQLTEVDFSYSASGVTPF